MRYFVPPILLTVLFVGAHCMHDTDELLNRPDQNLMDIIVDFDLYDTTEISDMEKRDAEYLDSSEMGRDTYYPDSIADQYADLLDDTPVEDVYALDTYFDGADKDAIYPDDIEDVAIDTKDVVEALDVQSDVICQNLCDKIGVKRCDRQDSRDYLQECQYSGNSGCLEWINIEYCSYGCSDSECLSCKPNCTNKKCGDDGCRGSCGECKNPPPNICEDSNTLIVYSSDGTCSTAYECEYEASGINCPDGCENGECKNCTPNCTNKECGPDGCGGICGGCGNLQSCNANGMCECTYLKCEAMCCEDGSVCFNNSCCMPNCDGKECGPDSCGGSCGECNPEGERCRAGICEPISP